VVRTIVAMSHHLGIKVIAEGVETIEHVRLLAQRRCDEAQGYYFSRPVSAAAFGDAVRSIERMFEDHHLMDEIRAAAGQAGVDEMIDRGMDQHDERFPPLESKQIVM
jgi:predicted signal transduction protein with EAL and GGDEF domain